MTKVLSTHKNLSSLTTWEHNGITHTGTWRTYLIHLWRQGYKPKSFKKVIQPTYKGLKIKARKFETTGYCLTKPMHPEIHISQGKYEYFINLPKFDANDKA